MEEIIRKYFACWLNKDEKPLTDIFAEDIIYSECYGPEYHGIRQIQQWFHDWNQKEPYRNGISNKSTSAGTQQLSNGISSATTATSREHLTA